MEKPPTCSVRHKYIVIQDSKKDILTVAGILGSTEPEVYEEDINPC
jgi:hypothetical protein